MNEAIDRFSLKELSGRDARLLLEWQELNSLCEHRRAESKDSRYPSITYIIRRKNIIGLPTEYEIWYRCKSIVGVKGKTPPREPIFGYLHKLSIILSPNYPGADGNPEFKFRTNVWHPNIRYSGDFKGRVCLTINEMGVMASLKTLVLRVEQYLKYQLYHAQNTPPYPEDIKVAEWVREEGEPNGWVHFGQNMSDAEGQTVSKRTISKTSNNENTKPIKKTLKI